MQRNIDAAAEETLSDRILGWLVRHTRLNAVQLKPGYVIKRRNPFGRHILPAANWFFRWSRAPISFATEPRKWARSEVRSFRTLHPQYQAWTLPRGGVCEERLPGESLWSHLQSGTLTRDMLSAAGAEFRRAHGLSSQGRLEAWSHGDGAMCNILFDAVTGRARLIDFEITHDPSLPPEIRQADDLSVFLVDLAGYTSRRHWLPFALAFLHAYGRPEVIHALRARLKVPAGRARLWWKIRANFVSTERLRARLRRLARALDHGDWLNASRAAGRRHRRRPSAHCQATRPGMPKAISRARWTSESASALIAEIPSSLPTLTYPPS